MYTGIIASRNYTVHDCEEKFLDLFGFRLFGPNVNSRYQIIDENNNEIGYIQRKKIEKGNKNIDATYGYRLEINSPTLKISRTRNEERLDDEYKFDVKKDNNIYTVDMVLGELPSISIYTPEYNILDFCINKNNLFCNYLSKGENHIFEDKIILEKQGNYSVSYKYILSFCDNIENINRATEHEIYFNYNQLREYPLDMRYRYSNEAGEVVINEIDKNKNLMTTAIKKHKIAINSFSHFRYLINQVLPFKEDIVTSLLEDKINDLEPEIALLVSESEKKEGLIRRLLRK